MTSVNSHYAINRNYSANGLNQYSSVAGATPTYDARGNMTQSAGISFGYSSENRMTSAGSNSLAYDSLGRLFQVTASGTTTQFGYDVVSGLPDIVAEFGLAASTPGVGGLAPALRRYVFGAGGEPLVQYEGSGTSTRRWLHADERGSIIAISDGSGAVTNINTYDEYGIPGSGNTGRFQYTGQIWLPEVGMYHYRARMYSATLGRFMQTDPIGFGDGMNIYAYVRNDPVNFIDPSGLTMSDRPVTSCVGYNFCGSPSPGGVFPTITVTGSRNPCALAIFCSSGEPDTYFLNDMRRVGLYAYAGNESGASGGSDEEEDDPCHIARLRNNDYYGDDTTEGRTIGQNADVRPNRINTDLGGASWNDMVGAFWNLTRRAGDISIAVPLYGVGAMLWGLPSRITLRVGRTGLLPSLSIDIPANQFDAEMPETIHPGQGTCHGN